MHILDIYYYMIIIIITIEHCTRAWIYSTRLTGWLSANFLCRLWNSIHSNSIRIVSRSSNIILYIGTSAVYSELLFLRTPGPDCVYRCGMNRIRIRKYGQTIHVIYMYSDCVCIIIWPNLLPKRLTPRARFRMQTWRSIQFHIL